VRRRHADVDDREIGAGLTNQLDERLGGSALADDLEAGLGQKPSQAFAKQDCDRVVRMRDGRVSGGAR
jgi:hypothetical protein